MTSKRAQFSHIRDWAHFEDHPGSINEESINRRPEGLIGRIGWRGVRMEKFDFFFRLGLESYSFSIKVNNWVAKCGAASYRHSHSDDCDSDCEVNCEVATCSPTTDKKLKCE